MCASIYSIRAHPRRPGGAGRDRTPHARCGLASPSGLRAGRSPRASALDPSRAPSAYVGDRAMFMLIYMSCYVGKIMYISIIYIPSRRPVRAAWAVACAVCIVARSGPQIICGLVHGGAPCASRYRPDLRTKYTDEAPGGVCRARMPLARPRRRRLSLLSSTRSVSHFMAHGHGSWCVPCLALPPDAS